jgi:hypothetical protein
MKPNVIRPTRNTIVYVCECLNRVSIVGAVLDFQRCLTTYKLDGGARTVGRIADILKLQAIDYKVGWVRWSWLFGQKNGGS